MSRKIPKRQCNWRQLWQKVHQNDGPPQTYIDAIFRIHIVCPCTGAREGMLVSFLSTRATLRVNLEYRYNTPHSYHTCESTHVHNYRVPLPLFFCSAQHPCSTHHYIILHENSRRWTARITQTIWISQQWLASGCTQSCSIFKLQRMFLYQNHVSCLRDQCVAMASKGP